MDALLLLSYRCIVTINVIRLFLTVSRVGLQYVILTVPWVGLQYVIVVLYDHSHLLFYKQFLLALSLSSLL